MENNPTTINQYNIISNKNALKDKIHEIHNFLRNNGAGYGMNAMKVFNVLYGLKKIEENGLVDKIFLNNEDKNACRFSYLLSLANDNKDEELANLLFGTVLDSINNSELKEFLFYEIPRNIKGSIFVHLIKEIQKITIIEKSCNVLLSGKIYEYFIGRDESAISELGAYFTDRHITNFILKKVNPKKCENGEIQTMVDMFGGSGGFTTEYINHLNETNNEQINWQTEINKIHHYDVNEDVIKSAGLELFCLTGVLPNMNNLKYKNSFTDEFDENKYHYVFTNPPYGGDKIIKNGAQLRRDKIKNVIKKELPTLTDKETICKRKAQLKEIESNEKQEKNKQNNLKVTVSSSSARIQKFAKDHNLSGNDKESCSLILIMDILESGGTAVVVLKEGMLFNKTYQKLRKCLVENYNVKEIISVPSDQFENTAISTSIIIFDNTEDKTTNVKFSNLMVEKYTEDKFCEESGNIIIVENAGDIKEIKDEFICCVNKDEILNNNNCSLNYKIYCEHKIKCTKDYTLFNLDELCNIKLGTRVTKSNCPFGDIPVYGGGDASFTTNESNRSKGTLIVSRYAMSKECVRLVNSNFFLNDSGFSVESKDSKKQKYINYILLSEIYQEHIYKNCTSGSIQKNINFDLFKKIQIPIPNDESKIQEWINKITKPYDKNNIKLFKQYIQEMIEKIISTEDSIDTIVPNKKVKTT